MKRMMLIAALLVAALFTVAAYMAPQNNSNVAKDQRGHVLVKDWEKFSEAQAKDRPQLQEEILSGIIAQAKAKHLAWDFYDAWDQYRSVKVRRNWKESDPVLKAFGEDVEAFGDPLVTFLFQRNFRGVNRGQGLEYAKANSAALKAQKNDVFYRNSSISHEMGGQLPSYISNDYEFALWVCDAFEELKKYLGETYPNAAYAEYLAASRSALGREKALRLVADKYKGKAVGLYAEADLLQEQMYALQREKGSTPAQFKDLYAKCQAFEKTRKAFTGKEAAIVKNLDQIQYLAENLVSKSIRVFVNKDTVMLIVRNIRNLKVTVSERDNSKNVVHKANLVNSVGSFYVLDTLKTVLPQINDGEYVVEAVGEGEKFTLDVDRHTVSLAYRRDSEGFKVYAADYQSGEPLTSADLILTKNGSQVKKVENFRFDGGFTALPSDIASQITGKGIYALSCSLKDKDGFVRKSPELSISATTTFSSLRSSRQYCNVYLNMGAFHPGDTVKFKGILYEGDLVEAVKVASKGLKVRAAVRDSEDNEVDRLELETNEFGSVAGEFRIPEGLRNGRFTVELSSGRYHGTASFRVDEYVLPTYEIKFDEIDRLILPGDVVTFSGKVTSYSGHSISDAVVTYELVNDGETQEGNLTLANDGSFSLDVKTDFVDSDWAYASQRVYMSIKVVDATGETQEANYGVSVMKSIRMNLDVMDTVTAQYDIKDNTKYFSSYVVDRDSVRIHMRVNSTQGNLVQTAVEYVLKNEKDEVLKKGSAQSGEVVAFDLSAYGSGVYSVSAKASVVDSRGEKIKDEREVRFLKVSENDPTLDAPLKNYYRTFGEELESGEMIKAQFGAADGPLWAVVELFGDNMKLLERKQLALKGERGLAGSLENIEFEYKASYPDAVLLQIFYFKDGATKTFRTQFRRRRHTLDLPLAWERFEDKTMPGSPYSFILKTAPDSEIMAAIYDKSVDRINSLYWNTVSMHEFSVPSVNISAVCGSCGGHYPVLLRGRAMMKSAGPMMTMNARASVLADRIDIVDDDIVVDDDIFMNLEDAAEEEAIPFAFAEGVEAPAVRENFADALAFEPFLHSDSEGRAELSFRTSDKLSTFKVMLFAHDKAMRNALLTSEMTVSIPVKVAVAEPKYLYVGDQYKMAVSLSSNENTPVGGTLWLYQYDGTDHKNSKPVKASSVKIMVPASGSVSHQFEVAVPKAAGDRGLMVVFKADDGYSDAVFVSVPVYACSQTLTEAHSVVILPGMDAKTEIEKLRKAFVNVSGYGAEHKEISIIDMVKDAVPTSVEPRNDDLLSLTEAYYVRKIAESLGVKVSAQTSDDKLVGKILACRNADGGFGWYEGMGSSPVMTAIVMERFAKLERAGLGTMDLRSSVKYLDDSYFHVNRPYWCGGISADQYLYVRSLYAGVAFDVNPSGSEQQKLMSDFRKYVKEYLVPKDERGLNGQILAKARRLRTLAELVSSDEGVALAGKWGVSLGARRRMLASLEDDVVSLLEYAVGHKDGGIYYPNAVMPFRGLLESEAYAHSMLCDLFTDYAGGFGGAVSGGSKASEAVRVADGIRIWLMLQKETQKWGEEPAYVDALNSVLRGSDEVKATRVILMSKTYQKPFKEIKAAGNGFRIERKYFLNDEEVAPGAALKVGDRLRVEYRIWNGENRSFVVLRAPREAGFRPVQQLSGMYGWGVRPLRVSSWFSFQPHGYRNVKASATEYYFDTYPEENSTIVEEFYVTQAGRFSAPVVEIESLYAPHYRANSAFERAFEVKGAR
ncbi:MAG: MG2 domain-containing protein [Bacteroidales bacterium]|nr:MG2 domain-containing protein [Bacteroidales bacterium]